MKNLSFEEIHSRLIGAYLSAEQEIAELGECEEHDEEHDREASNVFGALENSWVQLKNSRLDETQELKLVRRFS